MYVSDKGDRGYVEMARALLKYGADVNIPDEVVVTVFNLSAVYW